MMTEEILLANHALQRTRRALRGCNRGVPKLPQHAACKVNPRGAVMLPLLPSAMHQLDHLLIGALVGLPRFALLETVDRYGFDIAGASRFKQRCAISGIDLVATNVGAHILRGK
jgi:hypothetical protein